MDAKKSLARTITAGFHGDDAAARARENWEAQFQRGEMPENGEEVTVTLAEVGKTFLEGDRLLLQLRMDKLIFLAGLADSVSDAGRLCKAGSVQIESLPGLGAFRLSGNPNFVYESELPARMAVRVGKRAKIVVIE
jgi:tyrosyl-tRNA synthetase